MITFLLGLVKVILSQFLKPFLNTSANYVKYYWKYIFFRKIVKENNDNFSEYFTCYLQARNRAFQYFLTPALSIQIDLDGLDLSLPQSPKLKVPDEAQAAEDVKNYNQRANEYYSEINFDYVHPRKIRVMKEILSQKIKP